MNITVDKSILVDALARIQSICGRKTNNVITTSVLIKAESDYIQIVSTDYETGFKGNYPAIVETSGIVAINGKKLYEIIRELPAEKINIVEVENYWIKITEGKILYHLVGMNPDEFPAMDDMTESDSPLQLNAAMFKKALECALTISVGEEKKPHTTGIFMQYVADETPILRMLSTDISRLVKVDIPCSEKELEALVKGVILSKKCMADVYRILTDNGMIDVNLVNNRIFFKQNEESISVSLMEGGFPPFINYIKKMGKESVLLEKNLFLAMIKRMTILVSDEYKGVVLSLFENKMTITSTNPNLGESREETEVLFQGEPVQLAINPHFIIDAINMIETSQILFKFGESREPCIIEGKDDSTIQNVIMPMRL